MNRQPPLWEDQSTEVDIRVGALLSAVGERREFKRLGRWLDDQGNDALRLAVIRVGRIRGAELPDDAVKWPGKRLLRRALGRETAARVRLNPIRLDEGFLCVHCGREVPPLGVTARDHCPWCLRSLHVDVVPGDRAAACGGVLEPVSVQMMGERVVIRYHCQRCGETRVNKAAQEGTTPDSWQVLVQLSAGELSR